MVFVERASSTPEPSRSAYWPCDGFSQLWQFNRWQTLLNAEADRPSGRIRLLGAPARLQDAARENRVLQESPLVETVRHGLIPPTSRRFIEPFTPSGDWLFSGWNGGVYYLDGTVCQLSLLDRWHTNVTAPYEPEDVASAAFTYVPGEAVYGGLLLRHFGHFLLEATNRLWWPIISDFQGPIVFQAVGKKPKEADFIFEFFSLIGIKHRVIIVYDRGYKFDRVVVPQRAFVIKKYLYKEFMIPFQVAGAAVERCEQSPLAKANLFSGLYLSRTQYEFRRSFGEEKLERAFARNGFQIAYPETLSLVQQISLARSHRTIAGIQGSALHNILFSEGSKEMVYICRDYDINLNFLMIDDIMKNISTYIYNGIAKDAQSERVDRARNAEAYREDKPLDLGKIFWMLERRGVLAAGWSRRGVK